MASPTPCTLLLAALLLLGAPAAHANDEVRSEMRWTQGKLKVSFTCKLRRGGGPGVKR